MHLFYFMVICVKDDSFEENLILIDLVQDKGLFATSTNLSFVVVFLIYVLNKMFTYIPVNRQ